MAESSFLTHSHSFGRVVSRPSSAHVVRANASTSCGELAALESRKVLGVGPNASKREVKAAYRKLALQVHPDVIRGDQESSSTCDVSFVEVNRAYESLVTAMEDASGGCDGGDEYQPREDFSSYYSNLKLYGSKAGRKYQYYQGNW